jgi:hypothetical protein
MACCSGETQTRKLDALLEFRPFPDRNFRLKFTLSGRDGNWKGRGADTFDFGNPKQFGCGEQPHLGVQDVKVKLELACAETDTNATITGTIQITLARTTHRGKLWPTSLDCIEGGPGCVATWTLLFLGGLGSTDLTVRGKAASTG